MKSLLKDAKQVLCDWKRMPGYPVQEEILKFLVDRYPDNLNPEGVDLKVKCLNLFYSTGILATNSVAKCIQQEEIDKKLRVGDPTVVDIIAHCNDVGRTNYSFATKYCALHRPDKYPIYDSIVSDVFSSLYEQNKLQDYPLTNKTNFNALTKDYKSYVKLYDSFMKQYGLTSLSYREVDWYLWSAYKIGDITYEIETLAPIKREIIKVKLNN